MENHKNIDKEKKGFLRTAWQEEMRNEVQKMREEIKFSISRSRMNRLFAVLDEIIRRL